MKESLFDQNLVYILNIFLIMSPQVLLVHPRNFGFHVPPENLCILKDFS